MSNSKCTVCTKSVFAMDLQLALDGDKYHKACAKCAYTGCSAQITIANFAKCADGSLLCKTHYKARFHEEGGQYQGGEQYSKQASRASWKKPTDSDLSSATSSAGGESTAVRPLSSSSSTTSATTTTKGSSVLPTSSSSSSITTSGTTTTTKGTIPSTSSTTTTTKKGSSVVSFSTRRTSLTTTVTVTDADPESVANKDEQDLETRPVSERVVIERPSLSVSELKARRATFGGNLNATTTAPSPSTSTSSSSSSSSIPTPTSQQSNKCLVCEKRIFPMDPQLSFDGNKFHKGCAKCCHEGCGTQITLTNFTKSPDNILLCKTHFLAKFHTEGTYMGGENYSRKGSADLRKVGSVSSGLVREPSWKKTNTSGDSSTVADAAGATTSSSTITAISRKTSSGLYSAATADAAGETQGNSSSTTNTNGDMDATSSVPPKVDGFFSDGIEA